VVSKEHYPVTVKPVLNGISMVQNIFPLKPGFRLIKSRDLKIFPFKTKFRLRKGTFKTGFTVLPNEQKSGFSAFHLSLSAC
jgi:hypothetical protein